MKRIHFAAGILIFLFSIPAWSMMPPQYLSVPQWQSCSSTVTKGTAQFACLPSKKPKNCPMSSWKMLNRHHMLNHCSR